MLGFHTKLGLFLYLLGGFLFLYFIVNILNNIAISGLQTWNVGVF